MVVIEVVVVIEVDVGPEDVLDEDVVVVDEDVKLVCQS